MKRIIILLTLVISISISCSTNKSTTGYNKSRRSYSSSSSSSLYGYVNIYIFEKSTGRRVRGAKVQLGACDRKNGTSGRLIGVEKYTNAKGFVKLFNPTLKKACYIIVNGKKYKNDRPFEKGLAYTFYID